MQVKTTLSVKEFRTRFAHQVSPEYAAGIHTTDEGMWISGKTTKADFTVQITKPAASSLLAPMANGKMTATDDGCTIAWKYRRPKSALVALGISTALALIIAVPLVWFTSGAVYLAWAIQPELWGQALLFVALSLVCLVGLVISLRLLFYIPKQKRERLKNALLRIIGEENIVE